MPHSSLLLKTYILAAQFSRKLGVMTKIFDLKKVKLINCIELIMNLDELDDLKNGLSFGLVDFL